MLRGKYKERRIHLFKLREPISATWSAHLVSIERNNGPVLGGVLVRTYAATNRDSTQRHQMAATNLLPASSLIITMIKHHKYP